MPHLIKFLGTAGARFVMIQQLRASAGTLLSLDGTLVMLDPGPGTLARCASSRPRIDATKLDAVLLSHGHVDHSTDVNVMMEAMSGGGLKRKGVLFAPAECLEGDDPVVLRYVRRYVAGIETLQPHCDYNVGRLRFRTSGPHRHGTETYGFLFETAFGRLGFVTDTEYLPELETWYAGSRVLVLNVVRLQHQDERDIRHLCLDDARQLIGALRPEVAILTHFGVTMVRARPWVLAEALSQETGVRVLAAADGMSFSLEDLGRDGRQTGD